MVKSIYIHIKRFWLVWLSIVLLLLSYLTGRANRDKIIKMFENKEEMLSKETVAVEKAKRKQHRIIERYKEGLATLQSEKEKSDEKITRDNRKKLKEASLKVKSKKDIINYAKELAKEHGLEYEE